MSDNPLTKYYRQPALYLKLPSQGRYWPAASLDLPPNGEIPVLPMSGKDDLAMRNADGLMNGATTVSVIESCCPNIKNAWDVPSIDLDALMIAIRMASYGNNMEFDTKCASCNEELSYNAELSSVLDGITTPDYDKGLELNGLTVWLKPNSYNVYNTNSQEKYIQQRTIKTLQDSNLNDEQKVEKIKQAVLEMTAKTVEKITSFIDYIITADGIKVRDQEFIKEWVNNADQKTYNAIKDAVMEFNKKYTIKPINIRCDKCGHQDTRQFQFEPSNFFG